MTGVLKRMFQFLNRDLTGRSWEKQINHSYFGKMIYFGNADPAKSYWEAELLHPLFNNRVGITLDGTPAGPEPSEEAFCRGLLSDPDGLFAKCSDAFRSEYPSWTKEEFPSNWRDKFSLNGFSVPHHADTNGEWNVCYFAEASHHYFTAEFLNGHVVRVLVDG